MTRMWLAFGALAAVGGCGGQARTPETTSSAPANVTTSEVSSNLPANSVATAPIRLEDVTAGMAVAVNQYTGTTIEKHFPTANGCGAAMVDFDLDGWLDLYFCQGCRLDVREASPPNVMLRSRRGGGFEDVSAVAGAALVGYTPGVAVGDVDNDGFPDLHLTRVNEPYVYLHNNGDGTFSDRSRASGLAKTGWGTSAAFLDYDNDGNLDLYCANYGNWDLEWHSKHYCSSNPMNPELGVRQYCGPPALDPARHFLFRSTGDGKFVESLKEAGIERYGRDDLDDRRLNTGGRGQGVVTCDLNGDGLCDIYVANDLNANFLFLNLGGGKFQDATVESQANLDAGGNKQAGMGVDASDADGDGLPDLFVTNFYREYSTLYRNLGVDNGGLLFQDVAESSGVATKGKLYVKWGTSFEDLDGDGWPDLFIVNGHVDDNRHEAGQDQPYKQKPTVWRNFGKGKYKKLEEGLTPYFDSEHCSRGAAFGDLFNDGQVHVVVTHKDEPATILRNTSRSAREKPYTWVQLRLIGVFGARDPIGARVEIHVPGRVIHLFQRGGRSYLCAHDPRLTTGLGEAERIDKIVVHWPSGRKQEFANPAVNASHVVREPW